MSSVLTTSQIYAARAGRSLRPSRVAAIAGVFAAHAAVSEVVQTRPDSGCSGHPVDAIADLIGITRGWLAFQLLGRDCG